MVRPHIIHATFHMSKPTLNPRLGMLLFSSFDLLIDLQICDNCKFPDTLGRP